MNGSVYKRCPCTEAPGAKQTKTCKKDHGSWYFEHDVPTFNTERRRPREKRGGFSGKEAAETALTESLAKYIQRGVAAERDLKGRRQLVGDYLTEWLATKPDIKASTRRSYERNIVNHLIPHLGHLRLEELGVTHIEAMNAELRVPKARAMSTKVKSVPAVDARPEPRTCRDGSRHLAWGELRALVYDHLEAHPGQEFTPQQVAQALSRSSGATRKALLRLGTMGAATLTSHQPKRFTVVPDYDHGVVNTAEDEPQKRRLSPATIQRVHAALRSALNDAVRRRILDLNPATLVRLESVRTPRAVYWVSDEAGRFLDSSVEDRLYALYHLAVYRGPRRGEILALRWPDLDLEDGLCEITRNVVQVGYDTVEGTPKSEESERIISLDEDTIAVLNAHKQRQQRERWALGDAYQDHDLVFAKEDGSPLHPEYVSRHLDVLIKKAGVQRITFHQLRHTAASIMLEAGAELKYVQHVLGYSNLNITGKLYAHVTRRLDQRRSAQAAGIIPRARLLPDTETGPGRRDQAAS